MPTVGETRTNPNNPSETATWNGQRWVIAAAPRTAPGGAPPPGQPDPNVPHGAAFLATLDQPTAAQVQALADGRMPFPTGMAIRAPYWQQMIAHVAQFDPTFDAVNYGTRAATRRAFTTGPQGQNIQGLNTGIGHLENMQNSIDALHNYGGPFAPVVNAVRNMASRQMGSSRLSNFEADREAVASESVRILRGVGGSEADVNAWRRQFNEANSPQQLHATVTELARLFQSRVDAARGQYMVGMGTTNTTVPGLDPHASQSLANMERGRLPNQDPPNQISPQLAVAMPILNAITAGVTARATRPPGVPAMPPPPRRQATILSVEPIR